jgi:hypothetical protein
MYTGVIYKGNVNVDKGAEIDGADTFSGVAKNGIVDVVDCHCKLVTCDGEDHLAGVTCLASGGIGDA